MYLTPVEERMLSGEMGEPIATAMRLLTTLGDVFGAKRMTHVSSVHISGVSYQNIGDPGLEFLEGLTALGAKIKIKATINPSAMDRNRWRESGVPETFASKQLRILHTLEAMGGGNACTCTPYLAGNKPSQGDHVAWSESSAVIYANSVLGARTNRESGISALGSALTGRTPLYGFHTSDARLPTLVVHVPPTVKGHLAYSALGYLVADKFNNAVPYFQGLRADADELKGLAAGLGTSGAVALFHIEGVTPEAARIPRSHLRKCENLTVEAGDIREVIDKLSETADDYDAVMLGCPQSSLDQLASAAKLLKGKKAAGKLLFCTSRAVYAQASRRGFVSIVEKAGGSVLCDTCVEVCPLKEMGYSSILTDSCKAAQYVPSISPVKVGLKTTQECLKAALRG